jgi:hypothetical protein
MFYRLPLAIKPQLSAEDYQALQQQCEARQADLSTRKEALATARTKAAMYKQRSTNALTEYKAHAAAHLSTMRSL